jgi:3-oxoacyl-[acyl-carrier-protein] synthase II
MHKVVITSTGAVSPLGTGFAENMHNLQVGFKGINNIENFDTDYFPVKTGAEARINGEVIKTETLIDRKAQFIRDSVSEVVSQSNFNNYKPIERAMFLGAGIDYFNIKGYLDSTKSGWGEFCLRSSKVVESIAEEYNIKGGVFTNVSACVASTQSIGLAYRLIKQNSSMAAITGGFDSMLCHLHYLGFYKLGALSTWEGDPTEACRPFDKNRCGLVIGEGASAYLLESSINADPGKILAEIVGYGSSMDSYMVTDPHPEGKYLAKAAMDAISQAGISPDDIDCVHAHETGTFRNALAETQALKIIFGNRYTEIPVFSLKGQVGHLIGACGALEILGVIDSLQNQRVLPTVNFYDKDPDVPLNVITEKPCNMKINYILKLNAAFGGQNSALVFKKYE